MEFESVSPQQGVRVMGSKLKTWYFQLCNFYKEKTSFKLFNDHMASLIVVYLASSRIKIFIRCMQLYFATFSFPAKHSFLYFFAQKKKQERRHRVRRRTCWTRAGFQSRWTKVKRSSKMINPKNSGERCMNTPACCIV